jgi:archaellum biogenesis ATPase FlaH
MLLDSQLKRESKSGEHFEPIPVVSPTTGENSVKQISSQYDFLNNYDFIVIGLDNDKAGIEAAKKYAEVLPKDKIKIATWTGKDPNQMLIDGKEAQFVRDFYNAKEYMSSGISSSTDSTDGIDDFLTAPKIPLPPQMHRIQEKGRGGIRSTGAIVNVIGDTSIGKSFFSDTLFYYWIFNSPIVPTIISLERTKEELAIDIESLHLKKNLLWFKDGHDAVEYRHHPDVAKLLENLHTNEYGEPRYYVIDERDGGIEALKAQMKRASVKYGSKLFILDPLTDFLRSLGNDVQEDFMMWEKREKKNGFVFINILHTRKPPTDKDGKVRFVTEYDALGSSTFPQSADVNIVLNRDKMAKDLVERNTTIVDIPKWRGGSTGRVDGGLYYDAETRQQYDKLDWLASRSNNPPPVVNELSEPPVIEAPPIESYDEYEDREVVFNTPE